MQFIKQFNKNRFLFMSIIFIISVTYILIFLDSKIRPLIITITSYQSKVVSVLAMNDAILAELSGNREMYKDIIVTTYLADGKVASVETDAILLNQIKSELTEKVSKALQSTAGRKVSLPLGTMLGWQMLSGLGPVFHFQVVPASYVESEIFNKIETAGINQTQYRIYIKFKVTMSAIIPGYTSSTVVENDVCIAETLIVGPVPTYYGTAATDFVNNG